MSRFGSACPRILATFIYLLAVHPNAASAQAVWMGTDSLVNGGNVNPLGVETILVMTGANVDGRITSATFGWSASPCSGAAKIKFFRPPVTRGDDLSRPPFTFLAERGPFDVTAPVTPSGFPGIASATQTVTIGPPVDVHAGDVVAITNLTTCGGPVLNPWPFGNPPPGNFTTFTVPGDATSTVTGGTSGRFAQSIFLTASGSGPALGLMGNSFLVTMTARDPRTGATGDGVPTNLGCCQRAGYFSLPAFTGDPTFPEVTVKIVDARGAPELGGGFWFFHAPLTDVQYTLTVTDQLTGVVRTYSNGSPSPGQLCGGVDTSAFPGP